MDTEIIKNKMIAVYCRVSTFDQEKGLRSQEKALKDYCDNHGLSRLIWYKDKITGSNRPHEFTVKFPNVSCTIIPEK